MRIGLAVMNQQVAVALRWQAIVADTEAVHAMSAEFGHGLSFTAQRQAEHFQRKRQEWLLVDEGQGRNAAQHPALAA